MVIPSQANEEIHWACVETRRQQPKTEMLWLRYSPRNNRLQSGDENHKFYENLGIVKHRAGSSPATGTNFKLQKYYIY